MKKLVAILFFICITIFCKAQNDSVQILKIESFIEKVKLHHPLAKVADITLQKAKANLLAAKGGFDPSIEIDTRQKTFDSKNYYNYNNAALRIPLPIGEIKTGIENNNGQFLLSEISSDRNSYAGIEVPLVKGLLIDKRRAALQQAKIAINLNDAQRKIMLNELLFDAYQTYYNWVAAYKLYNIFKDYVKVSNDRLRLVKITFINGDRAAMDTTEAQIQLQSFLIQQADAEMKMSSAKYLLNNFLWDANSVPQSLNDNILPDTNLLNNKIIANGILQTMNNALQQNPILQLYKFKIDGLLVDKKLKFQELLPTINLKANILSKDYYVFKNNGPAFLDNNNTWGINLKIPLRFREGRGAYKLAKLKIEESNYELQQKKIELENKVKDYYNQLSLLQKQLGVASETNINYKALLRNEILRYNNGESSLFLVNNRENKMLEIQQKIIELQFKLVKAKYSLDLASGSIN